MKAVGSTLALSLAALTGLMGWADRTAAQITQTTTTTTTIANQPIRDDVQIIVPPLPRHRPWAPQLIPIEVSSINTSITIDEQAAGTTLELTLTNKGGVNQEAVLILPVPDGVAVRSLQYDGTGPEPTAQVLTREQAREIYDSIVRKVRDPALVEFVGYNLIRTSAFPIPAGRSQKLSLTYEQVLTLDGDRVD